MSQEKHERNKACDLRTLVEVWVERGKEGKERESCHGMVVTFTRHGACMVSPASPAGPASLLGAQQCQGSQNQWVFPYKGSPISTKLSFSALVPLALSQINPGKVPTPFLFNHHLLLTAYLPLLISFLSTCWFVFHQIWIRTIDILINSIKLCLERVTLWMSYLNDTPTQCIEFFSTFPSFPIALYDAF